jgi:DNA-binding SARP family transcriptional activator
MYRSSDAAYSREPLSKRYATRILIALGMGEQTKKCYRPADMAKLRLTLLGGFEARTDSGLSLAISRKNAQMLLAYLAMHPKQTHLRDKLATLLWDDVSAEQARLSLRQTLFIIRQALPFDPTVVDGNGVAFAEDAVTVDVTEFEQIARSHDPDELERAAALYQGDLLEGISPGSTQFEEWLRTEREHLHELALEAFAKLLRHQMKLSDAEPAIQTAQRLLSLDPLQEATHRALMRLYARQGRRAAALRQYQLCVDVLQRELGVEPEEATKQVYRELLPQPSTRVAAQTDPDPLPQRRRRHRSAHRRSERLTPPLIGRDTEVDRLSRALAQACAGHGQAIALLGEAGIGKTRLIAALRQATARRGAQAVIGRAYETERLLPFGPWVQAIREAGITKSRALEGLGAGWVADLSYLLTELRPPEWPLPSGPIEALRLFDAMTELVKSLAARRPLLLVLEDLHWADEMSVRLFSFLARRLEGRRILLVGTAREEELDDSSPVRRMLAELSTEERLVRFPLAPLSQEHTRVLVRSLAERSSADEASLTRLEDRIWMLSEGNPFVIVESLREVLATARQSTPPNLPALPQKVQELIVGRFERLSDTGQHLLGTAAVIGRDVEFRVLQRAADVGDADAATAVETLVRMQILHSIGERFDFTHDRFREVAYGRLLPTRRRLLHARVVAALEDVYDVPDMIETVHPDRLGEHVEQLAYHAVRGELGEKAVPYLAQAGLRATARSALREALAWFQQALGVLQEMPESRLTLEQGLYIRTELYWVLLNLGEVRSSLQPLREAEALAERLNDDSRRGQVLALIPSSLADLGELDEACIAGTRALAIAQRLGDRMLKIRAIRHLAQAHYYRGDSKAVVELVRDNLGAFPTNRIDEATTTAPRRARKLVPAGDTFVHTRTLTGSQRHAEILNTLGPGPDDPRRSEPPSNIQALPRYSAFWEIPLAVSSLGFLVLSLADLGRFVEGAAYEAEAIQLAERTDNARYIGFAYGTAASFHLTKGAWGRARDLIEHAVAVIRNGNVVLQLPLAVARSAWVLAQIGETSEAVNRLREGEQLAERHAARGIVSLREYHALGRTCLALGRLSEAQQLSERAVEHPHLSLGWRAYALHLLGDIATHPDRIDEESAERYYREALALAEPRGMRPLVAHCHLGLGKLYRRTGKRQEAQEHLTTATTMYREMEMTYWLEQAEAERELAG